jgi:hypothetical protein
MAWTDKRIPIGQKRPGPLVGQPERTHDPNEDQGVDVQPARKLCNFAGWLYDPKNRGYYTGWNQPWRQ